MQRHWNIFEQGLADIIRYLNDNCQTLFKFVPMALHCVSLRKIFTSLVVVDEVAESDLVKGNYVDVIKKAFSFVLCR